MFAVQEQEFRVRMLTASELPRPFDSLEEVKKARLAIAEMLLRAGVDRGVKFVTKQKVTDEDDVHHQVMMSRAPNYLALLANANLNSGGPEVLELLDSVQAELEPQSLKSACRLAIRRHLSKPIRLPGNVDSLPLPEQIKCWIARDSMPLSTL